MNYPCSFVLQWTDCSHRANPSDWHSKAVAGNPGLQASQHHTSTTATQTFASGNERFPLRRQYKNAQNPAEQDISNTQHCRSTRVPWYPRQLAQYPYQQDAVTSSNGTGMPARGYCCCIRRYTSLWAWGGGGGGAGLRTGYRRQTSKSLLCSASDVLW